MSDENQALIEQLREANQNLVIATLAAQDLQAKAEAINRRQDEFLSMLAHELRNPLAPIMMATELLGKITAAHQQLPKLHGIISRQVGHMRLLIDDLVDASRVRSGKITLRRRLLKISEIIESAVETSQPAIDSRHQNIVIDLPDNPNIDGDPTRLAQAFSNLLINASKFTPEHGHIGVSVHQQENTVTVSIKDNGIGIAPDLQPHIFELFTQGPRPLDRSQGGLGLGLSLVRSIVEMHEGKVIVRSGGENLGSEFIVSLPISGAPLPRESSRRPKAIPIGSCQILLIEDNVDSIEALSDMLTLEGHRVTSALDGKTGLAMAKENTYDIIVCDIGLPGLDGYEIVKQLRQQALLPAPCFIALSGYSQAENRIRAKEAGFDHYLVKPVSADVLLGVISSRIFQ